MVYSPIKDLTGQNPFKNTKDKVATTFNPILGGNDGIVGTGDDPQQYKSDKDSSNVMNPIVGGEDKTVFTPDDPKLSDPKADQKTQDNMIPEVNVPSLPKVKIPKLDNPLGNQFDNKAGGGFADMYKNAFQGGAKAVKKQLNGLKIANLNPLNGLGSTVVKLGTVVVGGYVVVKILGSDKKKGMK